MRRGLLPRAALSLILVLSATPQLALAAPAATASGAKAAASPAAAATPAPAAAATTPKSLTESLTGDAKSEYESAKILYAAGDFAGAALKFHHAHTLSGDARLLWNEAAAEKNLRHYVRVETLLKDYLQRGGPTSEADRADAEALIDTVRAFIGVVTVTASEPGAAVSVDDVQVGITPLPAPLRVDMGSRRIRISKDGFKETTQTIEVIGSSQSSVDVKLEPQLHEGSIRIVGGAGTTIRVDGKLVGLGQWQGTLSSGLHTVEVTADHKLPYRSDSLIQDGQLTTVQVALQSEPIAPVTPIEASSSNLTWLWVAGGAVLATGLGVGAYFLFRPEDQGPPAPLEGTIGSVQLTLGRR
jgi:hypothetical protein